MPRMPPAATRAGHVRRRQQLTGAAAGSTDATGAVAPAEATAVAALSAAVTRALAGASTAVSGWADLDRVAVVVPRTGAGRRRAGAAVTGRSDPDIERSTRANVRSWTAAYRSMTMPSAREAKATTTEVHRNTPAADSTTVTGTSTARPRNAIPRTRRPSRLHRDRFTRGERRGDAEPSPAEPRPAEPRPATGPGEPVGRADRVERSLPSARPAGSRGQSRGPGTGGPGDQRRGEGGIHRRSGSRLGRGEHRATFEQADRLAESVDRARGRQGLTAADPVLDEEGSPDRHDRDEDQRRGLHATTVGTCGGPPADLARCVADEADVTGVKCPDSVPRPPLRTARATSGSSAAPPAPRR
jgi:hypothetical protein